MPNTVVVFHSGYGHTLRLAQAVADGAEARLLPIDADGNLPSGGWDELQAADAIIFGSPTYMGGPSWQFKRFADASSKPFYAQAWKDKLFAGFTTSGAVNGDKLATLTYFITLAMQHGGLWIGNGMLAANTRAAHRNDVNWIGAYGGVMAHTPADASPAEMPPGDLETGRLFGERVQAAAQRWGG